MLLLSWGREVCCLALLDEADLRAAVHQAAGQPLLVLAVPPPAPATGRTRQQRSGLRRTGNGREPDPDRDRDADDREGDSRSLLAMNPHLADLLLGTASNQSGRLPNRQKQRDGGVAARRGSEEGSKVLWRGTSLMLEARDSNPRGPGGSSSTCGPVLRLSTSSGATSLRCVLANAVLGFLASRFSADRGLVWLFQDTVNRLLSGQLAPAHHFIPGDFGADRYFLSMKISPFKLRTARPGAGAAAQGGPRGSRVLPALLLELDVPYEGRDLAARLQRDYLIMSNIPSPVTIFDMAGHVLHQNRASVAYLGYRVGQGLRAREEARRAARDGVGAAGGGTTAAGAPEAAPVLAELFCLNPDKLAGLLAALEQGKEWRGLVRMAPSLVPQLERGEGWDYGPEGGEAEAPPQDRTSQTASDGVSQPLLHPGLTQALGLGNREDGHDAGASQLLASASGSADADAFTIDLFFSNNVRSAGRGAGCIGSAGAGGRNVGSVDGAIGVAAAGGGRTGASPVRAPSMAATQVSCERGAAAGSGGDSVTSSAAYQTAPGPGPRSGLWAPSSSGRKAGSSLGDGESVMLGTGMSAAAEAWHQEFAAVAVPPSATRQQPPGQLLSRHGRGHQPPAGEARRLMGNGCVLSAPADRLPYGADTAAAVPAGHRLPGSDPHPAPWDHRNDLGAGPPTDAGGSSLATHPPQLIAVAGATSAPAAVRMTSLDPPRPTAAELWARLLPGGTGGDGGATAATTVLGGGAGGSPGPAPTGFQSRHPSLDLTVRGVTCLSCPEAESCPTLAVGAARVDLSQHAHADADADGGAAPQDLFSAPPPVTGSWGPRPSALPQSPGGIKRSSSVVLVQFVTPAAVTGGPSSGPSGTRSSAASDPRARLRQVLRTVLTSSAGGDIRAGAAGGNIATLSLPGRARSGSRGRIRSSYDACPVVQPRVQSASMGSAARLVDDRGGGGGSAEKAAAAAGAAAATGPRRHRQPPRHASSRALLLGPGMANWGPSLADIQPLVTTAAGAAGGQGAAGVGTIPAGGGGGHGGGDDWRGGGTSGDGTLGPYPGCAAGGVRWHEVAVKPVVDPMSGERVLLLVQTDVSKQIAAEEVLASVLEAEHRLLADVFPQHVVADMTAARNASAEAARRGFKLLGHIQDPAALATSHECITILFADIKGFTCMCKEVPPAAVMTFLNDLYTRLDSLTDVYGVMRIGIHSGPATSGVVGAKMPRFCLFGDTVNTASRMESTGTPGCIHISAATRALLPATEDELGWAPSGGVEVKGKGTMETFLWAPNSRAASKQRAEQRRTASILGTFSARTIAAAAAAVAASASAGCEEGPGSSSAAVLAAGGSTAASLGNGRQSAPGTR
ncbi:hypothetical protein GPECTOR_80g148 [Gonium pectorale]|uniref:Guanylate cyclase domain-containing protein n=1 Tax=Gonium pectorale TaxID=33097 RepID=A0A150G1S5_GONPE|nr:hypothetical protein GPECTOR_80g148 [Gonium pectorale]|eukprot:KXZ43788.1 hypothetical protein GPECTOR_80g148 [Gonium pectorale]